MNLLRKIARTSVEHKLGAVFALCVIIWGFLVRRLPFERDDLTWLRVISPIDARVCDYFRPDWGWYYRPLFLCYWATMLRLFGPNPLAFHLIAVAIHAANALLLGWLCARVFGNSDWTATPLSRRAGGICTLLFFVWPVAQAAYTWLSANSVLWACLGSLGALHCWVCYFQSKSTARRALYLISTFLSLTAGLLFKEEAATTLLPLALLWWASRGRSRSSVWVLAPFAALIMAHYILTREAYAHVHYFARGHTFSPESVALAWHAVFMDVLMTSKMPLNFAFVVAVGYGLYRLKDSRLFAAFLVTLAVATPVPLFVGAADTHYIYFGVAGSSVWFSWWLTAYSHRVRQTFLTAQRTLAALAFALVCALLARAVTDYFEWPDRWEWSAGSTRLVVAEGLLLLSIAGLWRAHRLPLVVAVSCGAALGLSNLAITNVIPYGYYTPVMALALLAWKSQNDESRVLLLGAIGTAIVACLWPLVTVSVLVAGYLAGICLHTSHWPGSDVK